MLIVSLLHEAKHIFTWLFLNADAEAGVDSACLEDGKQNRYNTPPPATGAVSDRKLQRTPEKIGTMVTNQNVRMGDSGFELEEQMFGGRFTHEEDSSLPAFMVIFLTPHVLFLPLFTS